MLYEKSIKAMHKAGRLRATATTKLHMQIVKKYYELADNVCFEEKPPIYLVQAAYNDGLRGLQQPSTNVAEGL